MQISKPICVLGSLVGALSAVALIIGAIVGFVYVGANYEMVRQIGAVLAVAAGVVWLGCIALVVFRGLYVKCNRYWQKRLNK